MIKLTSSGVVFNDGNTQTFSKSYDGIYPITTNQTIPNTSWKKMCVVTGSVTNVTLPTLASAQIGDKIYIQNSMTGSLGITAPTGTIFWQGTQSTTYFELNSYERVEIIKISSSEYDISSSYSRQYPYYDSGVTISYGTWYECPADGVISVRLGGSYMNDAGLFAGTSTSNYSLVAWFGDDWNTNSKLDGISIPVAARTWIIVSGSGWIAHGWEDAAISFYPGFVF